MVQLMWQEKKNSNIWQWQEPETTCLTGEKRLIKLEEIEEELPLDKRWKSSSSETTNKWSLDRSQFPLLLSEYNLLNEPSPLGLRLKKSPSLLELIQTRLSQSKKTDCALLSENPEVGKKEKVKARVGMSASIDRLKASNFPGAILRIGQWEYESRHEGDLVGKCYFAKHKLVWEVLDGGLKNKIEMQWEDIVGLKANCPDNGPGTLTVVLGKPPLFFRETDPQPRKHTLWKATSDFTNGEASKYRQHHLRCAQGVLNKHYEKLIQCDTRLYFLSQQLDMVSDLPFATEASINAPNVSGFKGMVSPSTSPCSSLQTEDLGSHGLVHKDLPIDTHSPVSGVSTHAVEEYGSGGSCGDQGPKTNEELEAPRIQRRKSISDLVNHIGHRLSEKRPAGILPILENVSGGGNEKDVLDNISEILLSDSQLTTASDETTLMARVNSLCCLLQDSSSAETDVRKNNLDDWLNRIDFSTPDGSPLLENLMKEAWEDEFDNVFGFKHGSGMSRKDSFTDLLNQVPRIASLPKFLFDISEDGQMLDT